MEKNALYVHREGHAPDELGLEGLVHCKGEKDGQRKLDNSARVPRTLADPILFHRNDFIKERGGDPEVRILRICSRDLFGRLILCIENPRVAEEAKRASRDCGRGYCRLRRQGQTRVLMCRVNSDFDPLQTTAAPNTKRPRLDPRSTPYKSRLEPRRRPRRALTTCSRKRSSLRSPRRSRKQRPTQSSRSCRQRQSQ